ncbi:hypothetical protein LptCag_1952 [Leptospirillum ferriphilum]|uniref:Uncharacterized protein n=1 Tax=Leptospirillum ferriphilum TaxID=178606 RepID=A0A094WFX4_9BACT|nr:hypothetical protein ABH19_12125 [Leptospirillum sp. Group II 'CF-1']KGA94522.1 hypothetical protein LptCag_1952 [Leptospirillum ferriphilum]
MPIPAVCPKIFLSIKKNIHSRIPIPVLANFLEPIVSGPVQKQATKMGVKGGPQNSSGVRIGLSS